MAVALCFCLRQARLRCWLLASYRAKARLLFPLFLRTKMEMNRSSGFDAAKMLCLESTPLGDSPPLCLAVHGLGWGQRDAQGAQSVILLPAGGQRHPSFRDLQPHGFRYLNHPKEQTHKTNGESPQVTAQGGLARGSSTVVLHATKTESQRGHQERGRRDPRQSLSDFILMCCHWKVPS